MSSLFYLTVIFSTFGEPLPSFGTMPALYPREACATARAHLEGRLNNPALGEKHTSNAKATCIRMEEKEAVELEKSLRFSKEKNNLLYSDHYRTFALRTENETELTLLPSFGLQAKRYCVEHGEALARSMMGRRFESGPVVETRYQCQELEAKELDILLQALSKR